VEEVEREFTEFVPDELIVSKAHGKVGFVGRMTREADLPAFTWLFEGDGDATTLTMIVQEVDLNWLEDLVDYVTAGVLSKNMDAMLAAIKEGVESQGAAPQ